MVLGQVVVFLKCENSDIKNLLHLEFMQSCREISEALLSQPVQLHRSHTCLLPILWEFSYRVVP